MFLFYFRVTLFNYFYTFQKNLKNMTFFAFSVNFGLFSCDIKSVMISSSKNTCAKGTGGEGGFDMKKRFLPRCCALP